MGSVTNAVVHLKDTVDSIHDSPMNQKTLEARTIAMEIEARNLLGTMEGFTQKRHKFVSDPTLEQTRLIDVTLSMFLIIMKLTFCIVRN